MSLLEPIEFALKKIKYLPFMQRNFAVYKNPDFKNNTLNIRQNDFFDFAISLSISEFLAIAALQLFHGYFTFNPFNVVYIIPLTLVFVINALLIAGLLGLFSTIAYFIIHRKFDNTLLESVVWRTFRLYSIINVFIVFISLKWMNDIFKFGSTHSNGILIDFLLIIFLIGLPLAISLRILVFPLFIALNIKGKIIGIIVTLCILILSCKMNSLIVAYIPSTFAVDEEALIQKLSNSPSIKENILKICRDNNDLIKNKFTDTD